MLGQIVDRPVNIVETLSRETEIRTVTTTSPKSASLVLSEIGRIHLPLNNVP